MLLGIISPIALSAAKIPSLKVEKIQSPQKTLSANFIPNLDELYFYGACSGVPRNTVLKTHYEFLAGLLLVNEKTFITLFQNLRNETLKYFCRFLFYTQKKKFVDVIQTPKTWDAINNEVIYLSINLSNLANENINVFLPYILDLIEIIYPDIRFLWLSRNELKQIPPHIENLKKLEWLDASDNKLISLPEELCNCTALKVLWLENNDLTNLPLYIQKLKNLEDLDLENNKLTPSLMHNFKKPFLVS